MQDYYYHCDKFVVRRTLYSPSNPRDFLSNLAAEQFAHAAVSRIG
jgi:hypothetical protein